MLMHLNPVIELSDRATAAAPPYILQIFVVGTKEASRKLSAGFEIVGVERFQVNDPPVCPHLSWTLMSFRRRRRGAVAEF